MHPLSKDLTTLTDDELNSKITQLYDRMRFFAQIGNAQAHNQALALYQDYRAEFERRARVAVEELLKSAGSDFNDRIDIN